MKLFLGDCLSILPTISKNSIDLVFTSPPYYNAREYSNFSTYKDYLCFLEEFIRNVYCVLSDDGVFVLNTSPVIVPRKSRNSESERLPIPFDSFCLATSNGFKYIDDIVWEKPDGASNRALKFAQHRRPLAYKPFVVTEYLFIFRKSNAPLIDKGIRKHSKEQIDSSLVGDGYERTNVWKISPSRNKNHPATFPKELARKVVSYYSYVDDVVLDPFMGIGTTGLVCSELGRDFVGIEKNEQYFISAKINIEG